MKTKIAIISVYFGRFPKYFECFKRTAFYNSNYDWFIFTDQVREIKKENNIFFIPYSLSLFNKKLSTIFNIPINIKEPNRIGDTKPIYAKIFELFVGNYDWWGWTDIDLLNGNFNKFLNDDIFNEYDVISALNTTVHPGRTSLNGPFTLLSMKHKDLYKGIQNYGDMLASGNPGGRHNAFIVEEKEFYDLIVEKKLKLYTGKTINGHLVSIIRYGKRKLPASWIDGDIEIQSYKEDYWPTYVDTYGCNTIIYHLPKKFDQLKLYDNGIIEII